MVRSTIIARATDGKPLTNGSLAAISPFIRKLIVLLSRLASTGLPLAASNDDDEQVRLLFKLQAYQRDAWKDRHEEIERRCGNSFEQPMALRQIREPRNR